MVRRVCVACRQPNPRTQGNMKSMALTVTIEEAQADLREFIRQG